MFHVEFKAFDFAFEFSPIAFEIFGKPVYWYGVIITLGIVLAAIYTFWRAKQVEFKMDDLYDYAIYTIILGIIGARAYYVLTNLDSYKTFSSAIAIWKGGLGIYGGIIGGALAIFLVSLLKKKNAFKILDCVAPGVMIGQILGRWGNYMNQEAFGINTNLPWGMRSWSIGNEPLEGTVEYLEKHLSKIQAENPGLTVNPQGYVHPTFLYESLWNLIGFIIINLLYKKKKFNGQIALMYVSWYGFGRMFIEALRTDSLYIPGTEIRISQLIGAICFVVGVILIMIFSLLAKRKATEAVENATEITSDEIAGENVESNSAENITDTSDEISEDGNVEITESSENDTTSDIIEPEYEKKDETGDIKIEPEITENTDTEKDDGADN